MRTHRFVVPIDGAFPTELSQADVVHQMSRVLKLKPGERVVLCDGAGREAEMQILALTPRRAELTLVEERAAAPEPPNRVTLYLALIKPDAFDDALGKAVQAGVSRIVPVLAERSVKRALRHDRLERLVREAVEQSGRGLLPALEETMSFPEALADAKRQAVAYVCVPGAPALGAKRPQGSGLPLGVFIGPEGGWTEAEEAAALAAGCAPAGLGRTILRAETAAAIAAFLAANL